MRCREPRADLPWRHAALVLLGLALCAPALHAAEPNDAATREYAVALGFQKKKLFEQAAQRWQAFIARHPQDERIDSAHYHLGVCRFQQDQFPQAAETFRTVLAKFPQFKQRDGAQYNLGLVQYNVAVAAKTPEEFQKAADEFAKVPAQYGQSGYVPDALFYQAECLLQAGKRDDALKTYGTLVANHPQSPVVPQAYYALGTAQQELEQPAEAEKTYQAFLEKFGKDPHAGEVTLRLGMVKLQLKKPNEAERLLKQAAEIKDFSFADYALLHAGQAILEQNRPAEAAGVYESLRQKFPKSEHVGAALLAAGKSRFRAKQWNEARNDFAAVINDKRPEAPEAAYWAGRVWLEQNNPTEAVKQFEQAIAAYPQSEFLPQLAFARIDALSRMEDRRKETVGLFSEFAAKHPQHDLAPDALYRAALAALQTADYAAGRKHAEAFLANAAWVKHERLPDVLFVGAENCLLAAEPDLPKAESLYRRLTSEFPEHAQAPLALVRTGFCLYSAKKPDEAISLLTQSQPKLKDPPLLAEARLLIGRSHGDANRPQQAVAALREAYAALPQWPRGDEVLFALAVNLRAAGDDAVAAAELGRLNQQFPQSALRDQALYQLGEIAVRQKKADEAINHFRTLVAAFPKSEWAPPAQYAVAAAVFEKGNHQAAVDEASKLLTTWPEADVGAKGKYLRGLAHHRLEKYDAAVKDLTEFLGANAGADEAADARFALAACQIGQKQPAQSIETYKTLLQMKPDYARADEAWYQLAFAYLDTDKSAEAADAFRQLVTKHAGSPFAPRGWYRLGQLHEKADKRADAIAAYAEGLKSAKEDELREALRHELGMAQLADQKYAEAAQTFEAQLKEHGQGKLAADARFRAGEAYYRQQKHQEALPHYAVVIASPETKYHARALYRSGDCAAALKQWDESRQHYQTLADRFPDFERIHEARYGVGYALQQQNKLDEAAAVYEKVTKETDTEAAAKSRFMIGECAFAKKDYAKAVEHFLEAALGYGYPEWQAHGHYEAGRCFVQLGKPEQARESFETVISKFPEHALAKDAKAALQSLK